MHHGSARRQGCRFLLSVECLEDRQVLSQMASPELPFHGPKAVHVAEPLRAESGEGVSPAADSGTQPGGHGARHAAKPGAAGDRAPKADRGTEHRLAEADRGPASALAHSAVYDRTKGHKADDKHTAKNTPAEGKAAYAVKDRPSHAAGAQNGNSERGWAAAHPVHATPAAAVETAHGKRDPAPAASRSRDDAPGASQNPPQEPSTSTAPGRDRELLPATGAPSAAGLSGEVEQAVPAARETAQPAAATTRRRAVILSSPGLGDDQVEQPGRAEAYFPFLDLLPALAGSAGKTAPEIQPGLGPLIERGPEARGGGTLPVGYGTGPGGAAGRRALGEGQAVDTPAGESLEGTVPGADLLGGALPADLDALDLGIRDLIWQLRAAGQDVTQLLGGTSVAPWMVAAAGLVAVEVARRRRRRGWDAAGPAAAEEDGSWSWSPGMPGSTEADAR